MEPAPWDLEFHMGSNEENWKKKIFLRTSDGNQTLIALIIILIHMICKGAKFRQQGLCDPML
jgi:hypothetical protein